MRATPLFLALFLPWFPEPSLAQEPASRPVLQGVVLDRANAGPVSAAELTLMETGATAITDTAGRWAFPPVAPGGYTLRVRRIGYAPQTLRLELGSADTTITVRLAPAALPLNELVVTAARREQRLADVAVPTEVVTRAALEATGAADLSAALTEQTGVQFDGGHPSGVGVMLQGLSNERVLVLMDGQPLYGRVSGTLDLSRVPTAIVERVEIVKGPQAALYGSEAMGGVVNIITRTPTNLSWNGGARATAGSAGRMDGGVTGELRGAGLAALVDVGRRDVDRASGQRAETGALAERLDGAARLIWQADNNLALEAAALVLDERQRWPSGTQFQFADNTQVSARLGADWKAGAHRLRPTLYLSRFNHLSRGSSVPQPIAGTGDRQIQRLIEGEIVYGGTVLGQALDAGVEVRQEHISSTDGRIAGGARTLYSVEPFAQVDWSTQRWSIVPGVRVAWNERWGSAFTPRLALRYRVSDGLSLRAAGGRGFRAPDFKELYLQFINDAAGYAVYGDPNLRPEHSTNLTGGAEWTGAQLYGRAQLFWNDLRNFIETRALPDDGSGLLRFSYANVSRGRTWGGELEGGLALSAVRLEAGYAYLGTEDGATGHPLLGRPVHSGRLGATIAAIRGLRTTLTAIYTGSTPMQRDEAGLVTSERDAFLRLDGRVAHRLPWGLELSLGADNLFNSRPDQWADAVGRQWYVGLTWTATPTTR
jgi:outer membrane receptor for ferrienterochelin and colicins